MKEALIESRQVYAGYGDLEVLGGIDLAVRAGDFWGIIGPNGSGKSTLLRVMCGLLPVRTGSVTISGREVSALSRREVSRILALVPQETAISWAFTVEEIVAMGRSPHLGRLQAPRAEDKALVEDALHSMAIIPLRRRFITELSGGERQRALIARALAQTPQILLLDEPTSHLDINHTIEIMDKLRRLNEERGLAIVCVSHDLNLAAGYCRDLLLLRDGQVVDRGSPAETVTRERISKLYGIEVHVEKSPVGGFPYVYAIPKHAREGGTCA